MLKRKPAELELHSAQRGCQHVVALRNRSCREEGPAEYLHVSMDQGQCFYSIRLKPVDSEDTELYINNILVEPDGAATIVHVTASEHVTSLVRAPLCSEHHSATSLGYIAFCALYRIVPAYSTCNACESTMHCAGLLCSSIPPLLRSLPPVCAAATCTAYGCRESPSGCALYFIDSSVLQFRPLLVTRLGVMAARTYLTTTGSHWQAAEETGRVHAAAKRTVRALQGVSNDVIFTMDLRDVLGGTDIKGTALAPRSKCEDADFEDWTASDERGSPECILGQKYTYRRVARTNFNSACFLPKDYKLRTTSAEVRACMLSFSCSVLRKVPPRVARLKHSPQHLLSLLGMAWSLGSTTNLYHFSSCLQ